jgi:hypothetical protein
MAVGIADMTGVAALLSMLACGLVPSLVLGAFLGRARAYWTLAACGLLGSSLWIVDFTLFSDPDVHSSSVALVFVGALSLGLVGVPLVWGAMAGRWCSRARAVP